jgi:hypothetical protein
MSIIDRLQTVMELCAGEHRFSDQNDYFAALSDEVFNLLSDDLPAALMQACANSYRVGLELTEQEAEQAARDIYQYVISLGVGEPSQSVMNTSLVNAVDRVADNLLKGFLRWYEPREIARVGDYIFRIEQDGAVIKITRQHLETEAEAMIVIAGNDLFTHGFRMGMPL